MNAGGEGKEDVMEEEMRKKIYKTNEPHIIFFSTLQKLKVLW